MASDDRKRKNPVQRGINRFAKNLTGRGTNPTQPKKREANTSEELGEDIGAAAARLAGGRPRRRRSRIGDLFRSIN